MKKIEDYLHLYLGCEAVSGGGKIGKVVSVSEVTSIIVYPNDDPKGRVIQTFALKPILRPLGSMTEDEAKELDLADVQIGLLAFGHRLQMHMTPDQFKKCLDKHFDLFGLIEAGLAIDATKTDQYLKQLKEP